MATDRPLYAEIADPGSLTRFGEEIEAADPSDWPGYPVPQVATWLRLTPAELMSRGIIRPPVAIASVAGQAADPR